MTAHRMFLQGLQPESWVSGWQAVLDEFSSIDLGLFGSQGYLSLTVSYALLHLMVYPFYAIGMQDIDQPREKFDLRKDRPTPPPEHARRGMRGRAVVETRGCYASAVSPFPCHTHAHTFKRLLWFPVLFILICWVRCLLLSL